MSELIKDSKVSRRERTVKRGCGEGMSPKSSKEKTIVVVVTIQ